MTVRAAIHYVCGQALEELMKRLIDSGVDVNVKTKRGKTCYDFMPRKRYGLKEHVIPCWNLLYPFLNEEQKRTVDQIKKKEEVDTEEEEEEYNDEEDEEEEQQDEEDQEEENEENEEEKAHTKHEESEEEEIEDKDS